MHRNGKVFPFSLSFFSFVCKRDTNNKCVNETFDFEAKNDSEALHLSDFV